MSESHHQCRMDVIPDTEVGPGSWLVCCSPTSTLRCGGSWLSPSYFSPPWTLCSAGTFEPSQFRQAARRRGDPCATDDPPGCACGYQARMISPVRHPSTLRWKAAAIASIGTGRAARVELAELRGAVLGHSRVDGVDPNLAVEGEGGVPNEPFDAAVRDGKTHRLGDGVVKDVARDEGERAAVGDRDLPSRTRRICPRSLLCTPRASSSSVPFRTGRSALPRPC